MVRARQAGFTLVEVIVSLALLAVALLGLGAVAALAAASLDRSLVRERAERHAASLLDSLTFAPLGAADTVVLDGVRYHWTTPPDGTIRVEAVLPRAGGRVLRVQGRRFPVPAAGVQ